MISKELTQATFNGTVNHLQAIIAQTTLRAGVARGAAAEAQFTADAVATDVIALEAEVGTKLDAASYTAADVLAKLLTVDGAGSGLDADLLDAQSSAYYLARANHTGSQLAATVSDFSAAADARIAAAQLTGLWTPGLTFGGAAVDMTFAGTNGANYVKNGVQVTVSGRLALSAKGSSTGAAVLTGLPFAPLVTNAASHTLGLYSNITGITAPLFVNLANGATTAALYTTPVTALTNTNFQDSTAIGFLFTYRANE